MILTLEEEARALAEYRLANYPENPTTRYKRANKFETQFLGFIGEVATGRCFGLRREHLWNLGSDGGSDYTILIDGQRRTLDVKTADSAYGLKVEPLRHPPADYYLLVNYILDKPRFIGWATGDEVIHAELRDVGYGKSHHINIRDLRKMDAFLNLLARRDE